jgi:hypothetical protein
MLPAPSASKIGLKKGKGHVFVRKMYNFPAGNYRNVPQLHVLFLDRIKLHERWSWEECWEHGYISGNR